MEAADWHLGRNEGSAKVRLLAVYPGEVGTPLSTWADQNVTPERPTQPP